MDILRSVLGMVVLLAIAFLLSVNKKNISLRTTGAALLIQIIIGGAMLYLPPGKWLAEKAANGIHHVLSYSDAGSAFIFGALAGPQMDKVFDGAGFVFCLSCLASHYIHYRAGEYPVLHRHHGVFNSYIRRIMSEGPED
ncbi:Putative pseudouridine transporter [Raoultella terrigena]|uniref:Pseudouridine transporter n=1 Tax=Raoultella terrigena TaxID=577 RepID=A0A3P8JQN2_RAOTE|nr:Putative pseudouridine transporter [Raoultella terrigena]